MTRDEAIQYAKQHIVDNMHDSCAEQFDVPLSEMTPALWEEMGEKDDASFFRAHRADAYELLVEKLGEDHVLIRDFSATWRAIYDAYFYVYPRQEAM